jgi:hypothetical protein
VIPSSDSDFVLVFIIQIILGIRDLPLVSGQIRAASGTVSAVVPLDELKLVRTVRFTLTGTTKLSDSKRRKFIKLEARALLNAKITIQVFDIVISRPLLK